MSIIQGLDLVTEDDTDPLTEWTGQALAGAARAVIDLALPDAVIEETEVQLGIAAVQGDEVVATAPLLFLRRLRVDDVVHLYSERDRALIADLTMDPGAMKLMVHFEFVPTGRSAVQAAADAHVLHAAAGGSLALVMPDGQLAPERFSATSSLGVDESLVKLLQLLADVAVLSGREIYVPEHVEQDLIRELLRARRILRGETVRGQWKTGQVRFPDESVERLRSALMVGARHQLRTETEPELIVGATVVPLGEIEQVFEDAIIESLNQDGSDVVMTLRAHGESAAMSLIPIVTPIALDPRVTLSPEAFGELLDDLEQPVRPSRLKELL